MVRKHRWVWITLFVLGVLLLATLATGWNVVLVHDYQRMLELARQVSRDEGYQAPWLPVILGSLGFAAAVAGLILFFFRLLKEMRLNQLQTEFLATVSHELKTPIATLELTSSLLREKGLSA